MLPVLSGQKRCNHTCSLWCGRKKSIVITRASDGVGAENNVVTCDPDGLGAQNTVIIRVPDRLGVKSTVITCAPDGLCAESNAITRVPDGLGLPWPLGASRGLLRPPWGRLLGSPGIYVLSLLASRGALPLALLMAPAPGASWGSFWASWGLLGFTS